MNAKKVLFISFILLITSSPCFSGGLKVGIKQGMAYEKARKILIKDGWQTTVMHHLGNGTPVCYDYDWNSERKEGCFYPESVLTPCVESGSP